MNGLKFTYAALETESLWLESSGVDEEQAHVDHVDEGAHDDTRTLRIVSIFVILAAGLIGGLPPLFLKAFRDPDGMLTRLIRPFAAGVILTLALVHIVPEAVEEMADLNGIEYPLGGTCTLGGIVLMILLEHIAHMLHNNNNNSRADGTGSSAAAAAAAAAGSGSPSRPPSRSLCAVAVEGPAATTATVVKGAADKLQSGGIEVDVESGGGGCGGGGGGVLTVPALGHSHVCVSRGAAAGWLAAGTTVEVAGSLRLRLVAYLFELGCIFHSVIIGISLGVNQTNSREVRSLLIALAFHQWLEGIGLASVIVLGGFSVLKGAAMIATYSLTCPVGVAVGMAIANTYNAESTKSRGIQGAFNGVSGGMLLYISLVQLVAEDMGRRIPGRDSPMRRMGCFAALCGGAASMCLLAVWA
ncbi:hypothetical protein PLESTF_000346000 [Pleodorina starrii]|nr:hypothetical protein PLESTF_000346000 [Pleodorina starrii]